MSDDKNGEIIYHQELGGFGTYSKYLTHITFWSKDWAVNAGMFFYPKEPWNMVDVGIEKNLVTMYTYPHNDKDKCKELAALFSKEIAQLSRDKLPETVVTMLLEETGPRLVSPEDFTDYYPQSGLRHQMFIFQDSDFGFPVIYCVQENQRKIPHHRLLGVMAQSSHLAFKPAGNQTVFGKKLYYMLSLSLSQRSVEKNIPVIDAVIFPTSDSEVVPGYLKTEKLQALLQKAGVDKFKVTSNGKVEEEADDSDVVESIVIPGNYNPLYKLDEKIIENIMEKASVNLSDLVTFGLSDTLKMIGISDMIIHVEPDLPALVRKMCIFQGKFHCVPIATDDDLESFLDIDEDEIVLHTNDTFPRKVFTQ